MAVETHYTTNVQAQRFSYNVEVILYRVVCELINNTIRHAEANRIEIVVSGI